MGEISSNDILDRLNGKLSVLSYIKDRMHIPFENIKH